MSSDDKPGSGKPDDVQVSDPDLPGLSSVFSTTQSGLKPLRRRARPTGETRIARPEAPPEDPGEAREEAADDDYETVEESPAPPPPPDDAALDVPEPGVTPAVDGIQLRPGLALVDTAEIPAHRPPAVSENAAPGPGTDGNAQAQAAPPAAESSPTPAGGIPVIGPPQVPPPRPRPAHPSRQSAALLDDEPSSARREVRPVRTSSNWLLYVVVMILAVCLIAALLVTVREL